MLLSYLKLSLRLLARNPFFTFINVAGLSVGFSVFLILWQYSRNELNSDRMWKDWERIAQVGFHWANSDNGGKTWDELDCGASPASINPLLKKDFAEIEDHTRIADQSVRVLISTLSKSQKVSFEEEVKIADANFFTFFAIPFVYGEAAKALPDRNSVSISRSTAVQYFGERNPLGEILVLNDTLLLKVAGVFADFPANSHFDFNITISSEDYLSNWASASPWPLVQSYIKTRDVEDWASVEAKMNAAKGKYWGESLKKFPNSKADLWIRPLPDVVFESARFDPFAPKSKPMLYTFAVIGIAILVIAWINYINLTLARTKKRLKEVATRKVAGAALWDFASQFVMEAFVLNVLSLAIGLTLLQLAGGSVNLWMGILYYGFLETDSWSITILLSTFLTGIIVTGLYPALMSAKYYPRALFNLGTGFSKNKGMITLLTTGQYVSAIVLIVWSFVTYMQLDHVITRSRDAVSDSVVVVHAPIIRSDNYAADLEYFAHQLGSMSGVSGTTISQSPVGEGSDAGVTVYNRSGHRVWLDSNGGVDENFIPFFNIKMVAGRNFVGSDRNNVIILSEGATQRLGFNNPIEAVGQWLKIAPTEDKRIDAEIIGVMKAYRLRPFLLIDPEMDKADRGIGLTFKGYLGESTDPECVSFKVAPQGAQAVLAKAKKDFDSIFPGSVFDSYWLDEYVTNKYTHEKTNRNQILIFTFIAIGIACLGLLGMMSHKVVEKTKEIGIRKILGARLLQIAYLLLNATLRQVIVAMVIAVPIAYYLIQQNLTKFTERIELNGWHYASPIAILLFIMIITIASVLYKAAKGNPVEALKYE